MSVSVVAQGTNTFTQRKWKHLCNEGISTLFSGTTKTTLKLLGTYEKLLGTYEKLFGTYEKLFAEKKFLFAEKFSAGILVFRQHPIEG